MSRLVLHEVSGILQTIITLHPEQILAAGELGEIHLVGTSLTPDADLLLMHYRPIAGDDGDGGGADLPREDDTQVTIGRDREDMVDYIVGHCPDAETDIELSAQLIDRMDLDRGATLGESLEGEDAIA